MDSLTYNAGETQPIVRITRGNGEKPHKNNFFLQDNNQPKLIPVQNEDQCSSNIGAVQGGSTDKYPSNNND
jgi:hypothetical protein